MSTTRFIVAAPARGSRARFELIDTEPSRDDQPEGVALVVGSSPDPKLAGRIADLLNKHGMGRRSLTAVGE